MEDLTPSERVTVANGLRVAADQYDEDVSMIREALKHRYAAYNVAATEALIGQFERQAKEARALADRFEP